jgi:hypothetical protein
LKVFTGDTPYDVADIILYYNEVIGFFSGCFFIGDVCYVCLAGVGWMLNDVFDERLWLVLLLIIEPSDISSCCMF